MFQFATFASHTYVFSVWWPYGRVSPFGNLRIKACLLAPRSLSQATTSFVACNRQGIHHVHLFTCPYNVDLCSCEEQRRHRKFLSLAFAVSKDLSLFMSRTLYIHFWLIQSTPTSCHFTLITNVSLQLINLYFFQIVKELNSYRSLKDQT